MIFSSMSRKTLLAMINYLIMLMIGVVSWYLIANNISQTFVGTVFFALGIGGLFSFISNLGFGTAHIKRVSEGKDIGTCIGTYMTIKSVLIVIYVAVVYISIQIWKLGLGRGLESRGHELMIYLFLGYFISMQISTLGSETLAAKTETAKQQLILLIASIVQFAITLYVVFFHPDNLYLFGLTWVVGAVVNMILASYFLAGFPIKRPTGAMVRSYAAFAFPIMIVSALTTLPFNIDIVMIQLFWDAVSVAIYTGGQKFSVYLIQISAFLYLTLFPVISSLDANKESEKVKEMIFSSEKIMAMVLSPLCILVFVFALPLVTILGDESYRQSYLVLQPLAIWALLLSLSTPYATLMIGTNRPRINAGVSFVKVSTMVIFNLIFIPTSLFGITLLGFGARGAAYATLISVVVTLVIFRGFAFRYYRIVVNPAIFKYLIIAFIVGAAMFGLQILVPANRFFILVIEMAIGMELYTVALFLTKGLDREELEFFEEIMNPLKMIGYIKNEFIKRH